jgi:hypothetical protein
MSHFVFWFCIVKNMPITKASFAQRAALELFLYSSLLYLLRKYQANLLEIVLVRNVDVETIYRLT